MSNQKGFSKIAIIIIVLILIGGVYFVFNKKEKNIPAQNTENQDSQSSQSISGSLPMNDWKTYRNEKYGFEFEHPSNWGSIVISKGKESGVYEGKSYNSGESIVSTNYGYDAGIGFSGGNEITMIVVNTNLSKDQRIYARPCLQEFCSKQQHYTSYTLAEDAQRIKNLPDGILSKWASGDIEELKTLSNKLRVVSFPADSISNNPGRSYKFYEKNFAYQFYFPPAISATEAELFLSTFKFTN